MYKLKTEELALTTSKITIDYYDRVTSTMNILKKGFISNFYTVVAEEQTWGYGRLNRSFESSQGGLYFSLQIRSSRTLTDFTTFSLVSGISIFSVLKNKFPTLNISLKYPNDIFINDKKFGGILIENIKNEYYILGIGLNINNSSFTYSLENIVTSLGLETGEQDIDLSAILKNILTELHKNFLLFETSGFSPFQNIYSENCLNLQKEVYITYNGEKHLSKGIRILANGLLEAEIDKNIITL